LNGILNPAYVEVVKPRPGDRILDLGSGLGQFTAAMAERAAARTGARRRGEVIGIERNPRQLAAARRLRRRSKGRGSVDLRKGDVTELELALAPEEWGSFDLVHTRFLLEHLPDPARVVRTMARAAKPGGRVFISDDDHDIFRLTPEPEGFRTLWKAYVRSYEMLGNDPYVGRKLVALLKDAGLTRVRNGGMFFGGCSGDAHFTDIADNLVGILDGAGETILRQRLIGKRDFSRAMTALRAWSRHDAAAQWYMLSWAEGCLPPA
jgi:SAM-dependent methyltransferase